MRSRPQMMMMDVSWISESRTREVFSDGTFVVAVVVVVVVDVVVEILTGMMEIVAVSDSARGGGGQR